MGGAEKTQEIGKEYEKYIKRQKKALAKKCPLCGNELKAANLVDVHCPYCEKDFPINELLKLDYVFPP